MKAIPHTTRQMPSVKESVIFKQNTEWTSSSCFRRRLRTRPHYGEYQGPRKKDLKKLPLPPRKMSPFRGSFPSEFPLPSVGRVVIFSGTTQSHDRIARVSKPTDFTVPFLGQELTPAVSTKNLDVILVSKLTFTELMSTSLLSYLRQIRRIRYLLI